MESDYTTLAMPCWIKNGHWQHDYTYWRHALAVNTCLKKTFIIVRNLYAVIIYVADIKTSTLGIHDKLDHLWNRSVIKLSLKNEKCVTRANKFPNFITYHDSNHLITVELLNSIFHDIGLTARFVFFGLYLARWNAIIKLFFSFYSCT